MIRIHRFKELLEYEVQAGELTIQSLRTVPEGRRASPEFQKAVDKLAHVFSARLMWLARFDGKAQTELFPEGTSLEDLPDMSEQVAEQWRNRLENIKEAQLDRLFEYTSYDGKRFANTYQEILTQLFGHAWYHRGQIAMLVKQCGGTPAVTDYVYLTRRPLADLAAATDESPDG